jgi:hypothetical protein
MIRGKIELSGGESGGRIRRGDGGEGLDGVELRASAGRTDATATEGGDSHHRAPKMLARGAAGLKAEGPIELEDARRVVYGEGDSQGNVHGQWDEIDVESDIVERAVRTARNDEGTP